MILPIPSTYHNPDRGSIMDVELSLLDDGDGSVIRCENFRPKEDQIPSLKRAVKVAQELAGRNFERDILLKPSEHVDLRSYSWEMMLTLGMVSILTGIPLRKITGTGVLDEAGNIVPVSGLTHKIKAARELGFSDFLVSESQSIGEEVDGINLIRVKRIEDAWKIATLTVMNTLEDMITSVPDVKRESKSAPTAQDLLAAARKRFNLDMRACYKLGGDCVANMGMAAGHLYLRDAANDQATRDRHDRKANQYLKDGIAHAIRKGLRDDGHGNLVQGYEE